MKQIEEESHIVQTAFKHLEAVLVTRPDVKGQLSQNLHRFFKRANAGTIVAVDSDTEELQIVSKADVSRQVAAAEKRAGIEAVNAEARRLVESLGMSQQVAVHTTPKRGGRPKGRKNSGQRVRKLIPNRVEPTAAGKLLLAQTLAERATTFGSSKKKNLATEPMKWGGLVSLWRYPIHSASSWGPHFI